MVKDFRLKQGDTLWLTRSCNNEYTICIDTQYYNNKEVYLTREEIKILIKLLKDLVD